MAKAWSDFVPDIAMYVADCPHFTIEEAAKDSAIEFFRDSRAWRSPSPVTVATTVVNQADYTVTGLAAGVEIAGLPAVWVGDDEIREARPGDVNDHEPGATGTAEALVLTGAATVRLLPIPVQAGLVVKAQLAYVPAQAATGIDDWLYHAHRNTIRELALAKLKRMQGKPWSDPAAAERHERAYMGKTLDDGSAAGPVRRARLRTKMARI